MIQGWQARAICCSDSSFRMHSLFKAWAVKRNTWYHFVHCLIHCYTVATSLGDLILDDKTNGIMFLGATAYSVRCLLAPPWSLCWGEFSFVTGKLWNVIEFAWHILVWCEFFVSFTLQIYDQVITCFVLLKSVIFQSASVVPVQSNCWHTKQWQQDKYYTF